MPKVSIVLPTYNGETFIKESIDSIINQTFTEWELIIVNDCSTDRTPLIIKEYIERDSRIKVIDNEVNQKLPKSLNIGFTQASGEYLTWTSDDNYYLPDAIGKMVEYLDKYLEIPMVVGEMETINENGDITGKWLEYDDDLMFCNNCVGACFMYRRCVLEDIGVYNIDKFLVEDYDYWLRILIHYGKIGDIKEVLYRYRNHDCSLTFTRELEIKKQLVLLRKEYLSDILEKLKVKKDLLGKIYYEFKEVGVITTDIDKYFYELLPELKLDKGMHELKKIIVYGAGDFGNKAYKKFEDKIVFYADKNASIVGQYKNNVKIISIDEMILQSKEYQIMVAVSKEKIYQLLHTLQEKGITECCVYQNCC